jgi:hypothetical protein
MRRMDRAMSARAETTDHGRGQAALPRWKLWDCTKLLVAFRAMSSRRLLLGVDENRRAVHCTALANISPTGCLRVTQDSIITSACVSKTGPDEMKSHPMNLGSALATTRAGNEVLRPCRLSES